jgi:hypothetical protein
MVCVQVKIFLGSAGALPSRKPFAIRHSPFAVVLSTRNPQLIAIFPLAVSAPTLGFCPPAI